MAFDSGQGTNTVLPAGIGQGGQVFGGDAGLGQGYGNTDAFVEIKQAYFNVLAVKNAAEMLYFSG